MDLLPWILLLLGAILLGGIYWFGKRREASRPGSLLQDATRGAELGGSVRQDIDPLSADLDHLNRMITQHLEPVDTSDLEPGDPSEVVDEETRGSAPPEAGAPRDSRVPDRQASAAEPEQIVALHVAARRGQSFHGPELQRLFEARSYQFGDLNIYHSLHQGAPVFSIVNMVKPGWFDPQTMEDFSTPGISLFMQLPGPHPATVAFEVLLAEAQALSESLGGTLQDADHSTLSQQRIQHLRGQMVELQHNRTRKRS